MKHFAYVVAETYKLKTPPECGERWASVIRAKTKITGLMYADGECAGEFHGRSASVAESMARAVCDLMNKEVSGQKEYLKLKAQAQKEGR